MLYDTENRCQVMQLVINQMEGLHFELERHWGELTREVRAELAAQITEECPQCDKEINLRWDTKKDGCVFYCPYCGAKVKLCSACLAQGGGDCDWDSETRKCKLDREEAE